MPTLDTLINLMVRHNMITHSKTPEGIFYWIPIPAGTTLSQDEIDSYMEIFHASEFSVIATDDVNKPREMILYLASLIGAKKKK